MKTKLFALICLMLFLQREASATADAPLWIRWSAVSPDGKNIAFCYQGDIYLVSSSGGTARQLTTNNSYDYAPVWSPDGRHIAFASDREGSMDVYLTSVEGGTPRRLTTHSGKEVPLAFADAEHVLYSSYGTPSTENILFPSGSFFQVYSVNIKEGSRPTVFSDLPMADLSVGHDGRILYNDVKGYEDYWRKHQTSSISRDVWMYDGKQYTRMTTFKGEDRDPVWAPDGKGFYYLSEQDGTMNVYFRSLAGTQSEEKKITNFKNNPVRFLSVADNGLLAYCQDGELYTQMPGGKPAKVNIRIVKDAMTREVVKNYLTSGAQQVAVSPKGKEIAFVMGGNVYVTSLDYSTTKQITDTPELERTVDFGPDGRSLVYASERDGVWQIYQTTIVDEKEKQFTYATELKEERLTDGKYTAFQPKYNPKGGEVAFLKNRTELCIIDLKSKKVRTAMDGKYQYSYTDGDQSFCWSPDGKWLLTEYIGTGGWNNKDIALVKADGKGEIHNLTNSGYSESSPRWVLDGKAMLFASDRAGYRAHGSWGAERDVYIMFFDLDAYDRFCMNKEDLVLLEEKEKLEKEEKDKAEAKKKEQEDKKKKKSKDDKADKKDDGDKKQEEKKDEKQLTFDFEHLDERTIRLTPYSTSLGDFILSKDATKLYYIAPHEGHGALWIQHLKDYRNELKNRSMDWASLNVDNDVKYAYYASGGHIRKMDIGNGNVSDIGFETFQTNKPAEVRKYLFNHIWKQTKDKLYVKDMNGVDWDGIYKTYSRYLPHITNSYDFAEMASEMLGELNVSHTGCRYGGVSYALNTASLGLFYDREYKGDGLKIKEIMPGSPFAVRKTEVEPGCIIMAIDGQKIKAGEDYYPLLAGKAGRYTRLTVEKNGKTFDVTIKPVSSGSESVYLYKRWVDRNRKMVDKLSGGRLAYVHIKAMNGESFHTLYKELLSDENRNKDAVIVDTRHNGGGWLHGDICVLLSGQRTIQYKPRGQFIGNDPFDRWVKPSCMLICEDNYSNAHGTPWMYKELGLGKLVGAPVPGTMTAVWWEHVNEFVFGIPQVASVDNRGEYLENQQLEPDVEVYAMPEDVLSGVDRQLERAVSLMLEEVGGKKK